VPYPAYAGLAITGLLKNYENAGIERTPEDDNISLSWERLLIKKQLIAPTMPETGTANAMTGICRFCQCQVIKKL
jgi:hypothetical protein